MNFVETPALSALTPRTACAESRAAALAADLRALLKPRITVMVLLTVAIGFVCGAQGDMNWTLFAYALAGIGAVAAGASVLNQWLERRTDGLMKRTQNRPLPAGRLEPETALALGLGLGAVGIADLALAVNPLTAALAAFTFASYVFVYTPLKRLTPWNTFVGAVPGALPPLLGYAAAADALGPAAWALFGILFLWQFPHFWAIAWIYREDYARAGLVMLPAMDQEEGRLTGRMMAKSALLLLLVTLAPAALGLAGKVYFLAALALGGMFLAGTVAFWNAPSDRRARWALWASLIHLPVLLLVLMLDGPLKMF